MIGLDTNVVVRYLVQDDPAQSRAAAALINALTASDPGFISLVTVVEIYWVLRRAYNVDISTCADLIDGLLDAGELRIGHDSIVRDASEASRTGTDFAAAVIATLGGAAGCTDTVTFDERAARHGIMRLL